MQFVREQSGGYTRLLRPIASPQRPRFARSREGPVAHFLKTAFRNFIADEVRREIRQKRGGRTGVFSLDIESAERQYEQSLRDEAAPAYADVAAKLGQTEDTIAAAVRRMRQEFRTLLRQEVADTLTAGEDVEEELRYLLRLA